MRLQGISKSGMNRIAQMEEGYQGFKNYETFIVFQEIDTDKKVYEYWHERIENISGEKDTSDTLNEVVRELRADHELSLSALDGVDAELLNYAFDQVEWFEIVQKLMEDSLLFI